MSAYRDPSKSKAAAAVSWHEVAQDASSSRCGILAPMDQNTKDILDTVNFIKDRMLSTKTKSARNFPA